jgi:ABC-type amino acid transport substrate-binding protein
VKVVVNPGGTNQSFVDEHIKQAQIIRVQNNVDNLEAFTSGRSIFSSDPSRGAA